MTRSRRLGPVRVLSLLIAMTAVASVALWSEISVAPAGGAKAIQIRRTNHGYFRAQPDRPVFILALGSDAGAPRYKREGPADRGRADSIHVIAINPERKAGTIIGIARDTYVSGNGYTGKINGALAAGGPDLMVDVVEGLTGFTLDYWMLVSFEGFEDMINEIGGVVVDIPYRITDRYSRSNFEKGQQVLGGFQALAFARNRHDAPRGDFSRSENQGLIMLGALRHARAQTFADPGLYLHYLKTLFKYVSTDLPVDEALQLGMLATQIQTTAIANVVADGYPTTTSDGASIVRLTSSAEALFADVADNAIIDDPKVLNPGPRPTLPRETDEPLPEPEPSPSQSETEEPDPEPSLDPIPTESESASPEPSPSGTSLR